MSAEQNKAIVRRYFEQVVNGNDRAAAEQLVAPDLVFTSPYTPAPTRDRASFLGMIGMLHAAFPDLTLVERDAVAEGDRVATRWTVSGTHRGEFMGLPATGRRFTITGMSIYRVAGGKIVEGWVNDDSLGMLQQLGALPAPGEAPAPAP
jgi:steroid delta-isomerase-like uncharacterized protein